VIDGRPGAAQGPQQTVGEHLIVFCNQYPHGLSLGMAVAG
jgi:hypothetical protein